MSITLSLFIIVASINLVTQAETKLSLVLLRRYSKTLLMPTLALFYVTQAEIISPLIIVALIFGWVGDVFLMGFRKKNSTEIVVIEEPEWSFLAGLSAFLLGHIAYVLYLVNSVHWQSMDPKFFIIVIVVYWYGLIILKGIKPKGVMLFGVLMYMMIIGIMIVSALAVFYNQLNLSSFYLAFGAILFGSSDSVLAFRQIKKIKKLPTSYIMFSYIAGQFLIIISIL